MGPKKGRGARNMLYPEGENLTREAQILRKLGFHRAIKFLGHADTAKGIQGIVEPSTKPKENTNLPVPDPEKKKKVVASSRKKKPVVIKDSVKAKSTSQKRSDDVTSKSSYNSACLQKLTLDKFVMNLVSRPHIASYFSITPDIVCYKMEFEKFLDFAYNFEEPGKSELARAIFPLFVLFYFNILELSISDAKTFYDLFVYIFDSAEGYKDILKELLAIKHKTDIAEHPYFSNFRENKYILRISAAVLKELNSFLIEIESKALWQAFSFSFYYEDPDVELHKKRPKKPPKQPTEKPSATNFLPAKKSRLTNKKSPIAATASKNMRAKDRDEHASLARLANFGKQLINEPPIIEIFIECKSDISALDLNQNETEFTVAFGTPFIFISPIRKYFKIDDSEDESHESEDEKAVRKVHLSAPVHAVKYFPGQPHSLLAASGTEIATVNTETETVTSFGTGHTREISDIDINSEGSLFCSAGRDEICRLWSANNASLLRTFVGHENDVNTIKFHKNGIYLMSGSKDFTVRVWNIENAICLRSLIGHKSPVKLLTCCPDRKMVASADSDGIVKLWDINEALENLRICDLQCYKKNKPDGSLVTSLSFANENLLAMCNNKGVIRIWDIRKLEVLYNRIPEETDEIIPVFVKSGYLKTWNIFFQQNLASKEVQIESMEVD